MRCDVEPDRWLAVALRKVSQFAPAPPRKKTCDAKNLDWSRFSPIKHLRAADRRWVCCYCSSEVDMRLFRLVTPIVFCLLSAHFSVAQTFEVRHLAGSPGGPGTADGVGAAARFMVPTGVTGD